MGTETREIPLNAEKIDTQVYSSEQIMELAYFKHLKNMEHYESVDCWCFPTLMFCDPETNHCIFKHYLPH